MWTKTFFIKNFLSGVNLRQGYSYNRFGRKNTQINIETEEREKTIGKH